MGSLSVWHWAIVLVIVVLVFGTGKLAGSMGDFAKGIKAFKKGLKDEDGEVADASHKTIDANAAAAPAREKDRASV
jgi:sec-independent protein translocase protein TatA